MCLAPSIQLPSVSEERGTEYQNEQRIGCPACGHTLEKAENYVNNSHDGLHDHECPHCDERFTAIRATRLTVCIAD